LAGKIFIGDTMSIKFNLPNKEHAFSGPRKEPAWMLRSIIAILLVIGSMLAIITWLAVQPPAISYPELPFKIHGETHTFHPGEVVPIILIRCNRLQKPIMYEITRSLANISTNVTFVFPGTTKTILAPGCAQSISVIHQLPKILESGVYQITGAATYKGPFNDIDVSFYSEPFAVVQANEK
jgi:hypothetical protein